MSSLTIIYLMIAFVACLFEFGLTFKANLNQFNRRMKSSTFIHMGDTPQSTIGGKIVITGIGKYEEDEFMLSLLNEQNLWSSVILATDDEEVAKKKFLSRTARYSGLLNILEFANFVEIKDPSHPEHELVSLLNGANSWIGFNVSRDSIVPLSKIALNAGVSRVIVTTELTTANMNDTNLPEFDEARKSFEDAGRFFTGIRHGQVIEGDEDNPYEIVNNSIPLLETYVERGVLSRVVAEILKMERSFNKECGVSSSSDFSRAYLSVLRSSGLTRYQEVEKMFSGGLQRVAQLTVDQYANEKKRDEEKKIKIEQRRKEIEMEDEVEGGVKTSGDGVTMKQLGLLDEDEYEFEPTEEELVLKRANAIMLGVWGELEARMVTRSTSKAEFFAKNLEQAKLLAAEEFKVEKSKKIGKLMQLRSADQFLDKYVDATRRQYAKLLNMERKELQNQKEISDTWVKYIYLLLEMTIKDCTNAGKLFFNIDEFGQTMLLREQANKLRAMCGIESYEVIYDPLDASLIVSKITNEPIGKESGLDRTADDLLPALEEKYGKLLKSVPALRGAKQIIELSIETLKRELPPPPPSIAELRATESAAKQEMVRELKFAAMRNRGKPASGMQDPTVGKL